MICPKEIQLSAYYDGELSARMKKKIEKHLKDCLRCQEKVKQFQSLSILFTAKQWELPESEKERIFHALQLALKSNPPSKRLFSRFLTKIGDFSSFSKNPKKLFTIPLLPLVASFLFLFFLLTALFVAPSSFHKDSSMSEEVLFSHRVEELEEEVSAPLITQKGTPPQSSPSKEVIQGNTAELKSSLLHFSSEKKELPPPQATPSYAELFKENPLAQSVDRLRHIEAGSEEKLSSLSSSSSVPLPIAVRKGGASTFFSPTPLFTFESTENNSRVLLPLNEKHSSILFEIPSDLSFSTQGIPDFEVVDE